MAGTFKFKSLETTDSFTLRSLSDRTKAVTFDLSSVSSGQTRSLTIPNKSGTIALLDDISGGIGGGTGSTDNAILRADGTGGSTAQAADIVIDDATTSTQNNVAILNNHSETDSALVLTPKGTGAFIVGPKPDGTSTGGNARGSRAINIAMSRSAATQVASGSDSIAIGTNSTATQTNGVAIGTGAIQSNGSGVAVGSSASSTGGSAICIGASASSNQADGIAIGVNASATIGSRVIAIGAQASATAQQSFSIGAFVSSSGVYSVGLNSSANLRGQLSTRPFQAVYWGGQTTNDTATILNLDATATARFTIAANTLVIADLLIAANSTGSNKALVARRWVAIRRDNDNNTTLVGTPQAIGTDQSTGSPTWDFNITADDVNQALQFEAIGATDEIINWRVTAFYRVA